MEKLTLASKRRRGVSCRTQGGLPSFAHCPCFFRVRFVVARLAQAHQIVVYIGEFRVLIHMFDVMYNDRRDGFSIPCAPSTAVSVTPFYAFRFSFPFLAVVIEIHCRTFNKNGPPRRADRRKSFMLCELLWDRGGRSSKSPSCGHLWHARPGAGLEPASAMARAAISAVRVCHSPSSWHIKCTGHVADHGRCSRKGGADYSCRRLPGRPDEERVVDICPNIHYTHFTPLT